MSQEEVLRYLRKCRHPKSAKNISEAIGSSRALVNRKLAQLYKYSEVKRIVSCPDGKPMEYLYVVENEKNTL